jgi:hypothetical protein
LSEDIIRSVSRGAFTVPGKEMKLVLGGRMEGRERGQRGNWDMSGEQFH